MPLTDTAIRQARPREKAYTLADSDGLALFIHPRGGKYWHFRYRLGGKGCRISLGTYPEVSLKGARLRRDEARQKVAAGIDPRSCPGTPPAIVTFRQVANEWDAFRTPRLTQGRKGSAAQARRYLDKDILPLLGDMPIEAVRRTDVLKVVQTVEERGALNVAEKIRTWLHQIFRYAMVHEYVEVNPATDLDIVAAEQPPVKHNPWLRLGELGEFVRTLRVYHGSLLVRLGVELMLLTGVRTAEIRHARHDQFDLDKRLLRISVNVTERFANT